MGESAGGFRVAVRTDPQDRRHALDRRIIQHRVILEQRVQKPRLDQQLVSGNAELHVDECPGGSNGDQNPGCRQKKPAAPSPQQRPAGLSVTCQA